MQVPHKGGITHLPGAQAVEVHQALIALGIANPVLGQHGCGEANKQDCQEFFHAGDHQEKGGIQALYDAASIFRMTQMKFAILLTSLAALFPPLAVLADDIQYDCEGKRRFEHRGAPSTVPADARHRYVVTGVKMEGLDCKLSDALISCMGLTPESAMRKVVIDRAAVTVSDTLEMPTSMLIFEGRCK